MDQLRRRFPLPVLIAVVAVGLVLTVGGAITVAAAELALPGEALYPVKTGWEQTQARFAGDAYARSHLYTEFAERRLDEIDSLITAGEVDRIPRALDEYEFCVSQALEALYALGSQDPARAGQLSQQIAQSLSRYASALTDMVALLPEGPADDVEQAVQLSEAPLRDGLAALQGAPTETPTSTQTITNTSIAGAVIVQDCYELAFLDVAENGDGTTTWRYHIEELSCSQDLSYWVLELPSCAFVLDASPSPWEEVHPDPNLQLQGIKWQVGAGFQQDEFSVVISGDLTQGRTRVGAKGPDASTGTISGPVCIEATATPTQTPTTTTTQTMTEPATATATPSATVAPSETPEPTPASAYTLITDNDQVITAFCDGGVVEVRGNGNHVTLRGACAKLLIYGNGNWISIQASPSLLIVDKGNENTVFQE